MNKVIKYIAVNGLFAVAAIAAVNGYSEFLNSVVYLIIIGMALMAPLLCHPAVVEVMAKQSPFTSVPRAVDIGYDLAIFAILLYGGWYTMAVLYASHAYFLNVAYYKVEDAKAALARRDTLMQKMAAHKLSKTNN